MLFLLPDVPLPLFSDTVLLQNEVQLYISTSLKLLYLSSSFPPSGYYLWLDLRSC